MLIKLVLHSNLRYHHLVYNLVNTRGPLVRCPADRGDLCLNENNVQRCEVDGDCFSGALCCRSRCGALCFPATVVGTTITATSSALTSTIAGPVSMRKYLK